MLIFRYVFFTKLTSAKFALKKNPSRLFKTRFLSFQKAKNIIVTGRRINPLGSHESNRTETSCILTLSPPLFSISSSGICETRFSFRESLACLSSYLHPRWPWPGGSNNPLGKVCFECGKRVTDNGRDAAFVTSSAVSWPLSKEVSNMLS